MANSTTTLLLLTLMFFMGKPHESDNLEKTLVYDLTHSDMEFFKRLFHVARYHAEFLDRFEAVNLSSLIQGKVKNTKLKFLHGLSEMRIPEDGVNYDSEVNDDHVTIRMSIQYPKLCLTCCPDPNAEINIWIRSRISGEQKLPEVNDVCAQDVNAELVVEKFLNDGSRPRVKGLQITDQTISFSSNLNAISTNIKKEPGSEVHNFINYVISKDIVEYLAKISEEAGDYWVGNCTDLEDMTDIGFLTRFMDSLEEIELEDEIVLPVLYFAYQEIKIFNSTLTGLGNVRVESFVKLRERGARSSKFVIIIAHRNLCIKADLVKDDHIMKELYLCANYSSALVAIDVLKYPEEPIKTERIEMSPLGFDISGSAKDLVSLVHLKPFIEENEESVKLPIKNFLNTAVGNMAHLFENLVNCNHGNCTVCD